ncbi:MAG: DUF1667 domain-containing protein [Oscillospiraceae bacterium]|nr:DUF1667 domain-containing protein [Oscillospiraceae bacterium]
MKTTELTCIVCPVGCALRVEQTDDGEVVSVAGNTCPRGAVYGKDEVLHPVRTLTTTVRVQNGERLLPVKTDRPIPKEKLFAAMEKVNALSVLAPVKIGDVLLPDLFGAKLVAAANLGPSAKENV